MFLDDMTSQVLIYVCEAYHACEFRDEIAWQDQFIELLVFGPMQTLF
jgi:hypothetical protein